MGEEVRVRNERTGSWDSVGSKERHGGGKDRKRRGRSMGREEGGGRKKGWKRDLLVVQLGRP
eukprot:113075-Rhodomonas_salina.2